MQIHMEIRYTAMRTHENQKEIPHRGKMVIQRKIYKANLTNSRW